MKFLKGLCVEIVFTKDSNHHQQKVVNINENEFVETLMCLCVCVCIVPIYIS